MAETKEKETKGAAAVIQDMTLPELTGLLTTRIMKVLEGNDSPLIQATITAATKDLGMWYESQPVEGRKEIAMSARKSMEKFRLISEQLFHSMTQITLQDI